MNKAITVLIIMSFSLLMALPANAEINSKEFSLTPFSGIFVFEGYQQISSSILLGARLGYSLDQNWAVEGQVTYGLPSWYDVAHFGSLLGFNGNVLYHFLPEKKLVPFLALGGGWMRLNAGSPATRNATIDYGGGIKYFLNNYLAIRGDFRQVISLFPKTKVDTDYLQNSEITLGVTFQFGGTKQAAPKQPLVVNVSEPSPSIPPAVNEAVKPPIAEQSARKVERIEVPEGKVLVTGLHVENNVLEIQTSGKIKNYTVFTLSQPSRLVIDVSAAVSDAKLTNQQINSLGIASVRFENNSDFLRIFLDAAQGRILPYRVEETDRSLRIIMTPSNVPSPDR